METILFIGIQATGKSRFFRERFFDSHVRINLDMLNTRHREEILLRACIEGKTPFVVDNTNVTRVERQRYIQAARAAGFTVRGYFFQSRVDDALRHNALRTGAARIPDLGLRGTSGRLELPSREEGFDELFFVRHDDSAGFVVDDWRA